MALQYLDGPRIHEKYEGRNTEQMPKLLADGKEPMNVAHLAEQRIYVRGKGIPTVQHDDWWNNYFDNADLWLRHSDGRGKVVPYSAQVLDFLRENLKPETKLVDYALPLPDGFFEAMDGLLLTSGQIEKLHTKRYSVKEAKDSDVWKTLTGTQERLDHYVDAVAAETGRTQNLMNTYFGPVSKVPTGRRWYVDDRYNGSYASGNNYLTSDNGRLVGVAPEAHVGSVTARSARKK